VGVCAIISKMSEPLIGPSEPLKIWTPNEDESEAEQAPESDAFGGDSGANLDQPIAGDETDLRRAMVTLWVVGIVAVQVAGFIYRPLQPPENLDLFALWLGTVWAGWAAAIWASSRWASRPLTRVAFLVVMFAWHGFGMSVVNDETAARYVVMLGGYGLMQAILFHWVGIPQWQVKRLPPKQATSPFDPDRAEDAAPPDESLHAPSDANSQSDRGDVTRQFRIGDLIAVTTVVAVLITAGKSYETLLADTFWWGLIVGEAVLLAVAILSVMGGLAGRPVAILGLFTLAITTGVGGSFLLDFIESVVRANNPLVLWPVYSVLMVVFSIWMVGFAALSMTPLRTRAVSIGDAGRSFSTDNGEAFNEKGDHETSSQSP
jgi:hypothetical protein